MWRERFDRYWRGLVLSGLGIAGVAWLAATGRLGWYVHPRYFWFTVTLCGIAAVALIAAVPALRTLPTADEDHAPHSDPRGRPRRTLWSIGSVTLVAAAAAALLVVPPTTLSTAAAQQRQVNSGAVSGGAAGGAAGGVSTQTDADLDARDWAMVLRQGGGSAAEGRTASFIGFVLPGDSNSRERAVSVADKTNTGASDVFFAARFVVSCCAVDAQPLGVPVLSPGWQETHPEGAWVEVTGVFVANPDVTSAHPVVLRPYEITAIDEPRDPYVY